MTISLIGAIHYEKGNICFDVYRDSDNRKVGTQYIAANIGYDGYGTVTLGNMTLNAQVNKTHRDNTYKMTAYSVALYSQRGKSVDNFSPHNICLSVNC